MAAVALGGPPRQRVNAVGCASGQADPARREMGVAMRRWARAGVEAVRHANRKSLSLVAAGVAFYMLLAIFPGVAVAVAVTGLVADPALLSVLVDDLAPFAPAGVADLMRDVIDNTLASGELQLSATAVISFVLTLWSASAALRALMTALHIAVPDAHKYGVVALFALSILFTLIGVVLIVLAIGVLVAAPILFEALRAIKPLAAIPGGLDLVRRLEPLILIGFASIVLTAIYWLGATRDWAHLKSAFGAAVATTVLWILSSRLLTYYVSNFADLDAAYGPFAAVAGLMLWFWISAFLLLLGVELTAALARADRRAAAERLAAATFVDAAPPDAQDERDR